MRSSGIKNFKSGLWRVRQRLIHVFMPWLGLFHPPVVIYSMGKVGSTSVQTTLEKLHLPNPIFHIHFLSWNTLNTLEESSRSLGHYAGHIEAGKYLRAFADRTWGRVRWKIITLVREPVGREISDLFENLYVFPQLEHLSGDDLAQASILHLQGVLADFIETDDYACKWFDRELKHVFGFDVYTADFDPLKGYAIYSAQHADILLIRLEDLSRCGAQALQTFLGIQSLQMETANVGEQKLNRQVYRQVVKSISFSNAVLEKIYNSRYARHFYSDAEILAFKERWEKQI